MGIRFTCPNGHKLHVKTFLAGKRGVCPHCGVGVDIPLDSSPHASDAPADALPLQRASGPPPAAATPDPFAAAPDALWYMRPNSGGQFGPASSDAMRAWISEGRVARDSLVWREGWEDWQTAEEAFPSFVQTDSPESPDSPPASIVESPPSTDGPLNLRGTEAVRPASHGSARRRSQSTNYAVAAVVVLALASVVLLAALIYVIITQR